MKKENLFPTVRKIRSKFTLLLIAVFILFYLFTGCKKKNDTPAANNNEMKATVVVSPGNTININATGSKVIMGCGFSSGTYIDGTNPDNAVISIFAYSTGFSCVTSPGTYNFSCEYRKNVTDQSAPIFGNNGINRGSITFTAVNGHHMEGYFNAVSKCVSTGCAFGIDSVIIAGTFKGDY